MKSKHSNKAARAEAIAKNETVTSAPQSTKVETSRREWAVARIEELDRRLGVGVGAKRERQRLGKLLA